MRCLAVLIIVMFIGCANCDDVRCYEDIKAADFSFQILDADTGEDLIFGDNPINQPDGVVIVGLDAQHFSPNYKNQTLNQFVFNQTLYFFPEEGQRSAPVFDSLIFEFESIGVPDCCEEYKITKAIYNGDTLQPNSDHIFQLFYDRD